MNLNRPIWLENFEKNLEEQARLFLENRRASSVATERLPQLIKNLTGYDIEADGHLTDAKNRLVSLIATQRRWARSRHPLYDLNRHLALAQTLSALKQRENSQ